MSQKFYSAKTPGVRFRKHQSRKVGKVQDRYWVIRYRHAGKAHQEALGWTSQGWSEAKAAAVLGELKENQRLGTPPFTLKDKRQIELDAQEQAQEARRQAKARQITFSQFWDKFYYPHCEATKAGRTTYAEKTKYNKWIRPAIGHKPLSTITVEDILAIRNRTQAADRAAQTIVHVVGIIRQVFNYAIALERFQGLNPTDKVDLPKINNARNRFLTKSEANLLVKALYRRSRQLGDYSRLSLYTGMRAGEVFALTWSCIDFENKTILIKDPKNKHQRFAYMTADVTKMLLGCYQRLNSPKLGSPVFMSRIGGHIKAPSAVYFRTVADLKLNEGVNDPRDRVTFHTLRHTFASWLAMSGTPIKTISELLGHRTLSMTMKYAHLSPDHKRAAVKALEAFKNGSQD